MESSNQLHTTSLNTFNIRDVSNSVFIQDKNKTALQTTIIKQVDTARTLIQEPLRKSDQNSYYYLQKLWITTAENNITDEVLLIFKKVAEEASDQDLAYFASIALKDLRSLQKIRKGGSNLNYKLNYTQLKEQLYDSDERIRCQTIAIMGNDRNETNIPLLKTQLNDPSPQVRLLTVQLLWRIAADGFDKTYDLTYTLQTMTDDEDETVAKAASLAVKDLMHLHHSDEYGSWEDDENVSQQNSVEIQDRQ